jgi:erythromycin esterase-like protein
MQSYTAAARRLAAALALASLAACRSTETAGPTTEIQGQAQGATAAVDLVRQAARPITGVDRDYDPLLALVGADTRVVLLGESTHGTHEFYRERARITQRLVAERGFSAVMVEGDWPDAYRVNEYVRGVGTDRTAEQALSSFTRFPEWMWRNAEVRDLVQWLRQHNASRPAEQRVGFYGVDVYGLYSGIDAVLGYLGGADPAAAGRVRALYACFEPHRPGTDRYGAAAAAGRGCESQARQAVTELERVTATRPADPAQAERAFAALRSAHSVANAEAYFRGAYGGGVNTWNLRDERWAGNVDALLQHLGAGGRTSRVVLWAHNSHVGDARHTDMGQGGEINIGQLMRERHGDAAVLVGFLTYTGTVMAATDWDRPGQVRNVNPSLAGSYGALFHATNTPSFLLVLRGGGSVTEELSQPRLQRAIGVVYLPQTERQSHYFNARLGRQFDAVVFIDQTRAVAPIR